jgi:hypothetical protein
MTQLQILYKRRGSRECLDCISLEDHVRKRITRQECPWYDLRQQVDGDLFR